MDRKSFIGTLIFGGLGVIFGEKIFSSFIQDDDLPVVYFSSPGVRVINDHPDDESEWLLGRQEIYGQWYISPENEEIIKNGGFNV